MLDDRNWSLPRWLAWLPALRHEPELPAPPGPRSADDALVPAR